MRNNKTYYLLYRNSKYKRNIAITKNDIKYVLIAYFEEKPIRVIYIYEDGSFSNEKPHKTMVKQQLKKEWLPVKSYQKAWFVKKITEKEFFIYCI